RACRAGIAAGVLLAALAAACGGGDAGRAPDAAAARPPATGASDARPGVRSAAQPAERPRPARAVPADAAERGLFSPLANWPLIAIHAVLLPDGRVLTYGSDAAGRQTGYFVYDVWDSTQPPDAGHQVLPNTTGTDLFCSSQVLVPLGGDRLRPQVVISNGDNWDGGMATNTGNDRSSLFDVAGNTLTRGQDTQRQRWYGTSTVLRNGEVYIQGGWEGMDRPEIRGADGRYRLLDVDTSALDFYYPRNFLAPDGRVFGIDSHGQMYHVNTQTARLRLAGRIGDGIHGTDSSAAMFRPGRILQFGGFSDQSIVIDINGPAPVLSGQAPMASQRRLATATVLADGRVLATGGSPVWNDLRDAALDAELWDPATGRWTPGARAAAPRLYHSTALLLPDATVLVAGGGAPGPVDNLNAEIYYPPYLFTPGGGWAARPVITATPDYLRVGQTVAIDVAADRPAARVALVRTGAVTHSFNMDQRFLELSFRAEAQGAGRQRLHVQVPSQANQVPPGWYLVFVIDDAGVPSVARILNLGVSTGPDPEVSPVLTPPPPQSTPVGATVDLALQASDPNGDTLLYSAAGLPPGLALDTRTGRITGVPTRAGRHDVALAVSDGLNSASAQLVWTVEGGVPLVLEPLAPPELVLRGERLDVQASASGWQVQYRWQFGDGTAPTAWSDSGTASHTYSRPGVYTVTLTVRDGFGTEQSQSFVQRVGLPPTPGGVATRSSGLLAEPGRLWVVNPDSDSVSVFGLPGQGRIAEIPVGAEPRAIARAADGRVWVASQRGGSLSVIDPASLAVQATLMLPRGSQPVALALSPGGQLAYVSLAASQRLLRLDTTSFAQTGELALPGGPGGLAVSADGTRVYVSRFITPPLTGEATLQVQPAAGDGGQVWRVDAAAMALAGRFVLRTSTRADGENQGRGVPNALGAPAISPDGSQAFVPSKQDNVQRGLRRDGLPLTFQNTVRAVSSRLLLDAGREDLAGRIDHDNASVASAALFDPSGVLLFVALETSREVAVIDAHARQELLRLPVGIAPRALAMSADGTALYVANHLDRSVSAFDLRPLLQHGRLSVPPLHEPLAAVATEPLPPQVLRGKQLFHDARDTRLARDGYLSCAACHHEGGHDGRTWDMSDAGEGLRNTVSLRGRAGLAHGPLHWSASADEVQDFEGQIRRLAGGTGLMADADFLAGTRSQPLGDPKAGISADLDALAAYVAFLASSAPSPHRPAADAPSARALAGRAVFAAKACASCHGGAGFTLSASRGLQDIGTLTEASGQRLGGPLAGIDIPGLRDVWATAPYLHDGSAPTLDAALAAHQGLQLAPREQADLVAYLREIGGDEPAAPEPGRGLAGSYFANRQLAGTPVLQRVEAVDADWGAGPPGPGVPADGFSVRWSGLIEAPASGTYRFQTLSDEGVRLWVDGRRLIGHWTPHAATLDTSDAITLKAGQRVPLVLEFQEVSGPALVRLAWRLPGTEVFVPVPALRLHPA
ncbi:PA14 domain-containing protein, partial [Ideonella sp.]|uniref:PA14 domain-containing protein n=1 Tax=Ideonella sp. TaxID=1929293 RepID=UPI0035AEE69E